MLSGSKHLMIISAHPGAKPGPMLGVLQQHGYSQFISRKYM